MSLREFLVKYCQTNKQIQSCNQCLYEAECNQIHINLIIKAIGQWLTPKMLEAQGKMGKDDISNAYYNGAFYTLDNLVNEINESQKKEV